MRDDLELTAANYQFTAQGEFEATVEKSSLDTQSETEHFYENFFSTDDSIPVSIFSQEISPLRALVKYLKEIVGLTLSEIGRELDRDPRTIWSTYDAVKDEELVVEDGASVPISLFSDRNFSILESLSVYLAREFSISKAASLTGKNYQTIYTARRRALEKGGGLGE